MATINNKLIHFKSKSDFNSRYKETTDGGNTYGDFLGTSIVFIQDAKQIWTHGTDYYCGSGPVALKTDLRTPLVLDIEVSDVSGTLTGVSYSELTTAINEGRQILIKDPQYLVSATSCVNFNDYCALEFIIYPYRFTLQISSNLNYTVDQTSIQTTLTQLGITATATELNYVDGVTSNIQTQLNGKANTSQLNNYLPLSGGTMTGQLSLNNILIGPVQLLKQGSGDNSYVFVDGRLFFDNITEFNDYVCGTGVLHLYGQDPNGQDAQDDGTIEIHGGHSTLYLGQGGFTLDNVPISLQGHKHTTSDITDFTTGVEDVVASWGSGWQEAILGDLSDTKNTTGTSNSTSKLYLAGGTSQSSTGVVTYSNSSVYTQSGQLYATQMNATNGFYETSDARLKNFKDDIKALDIVSKIPTKYFTWKKDEIVENVDPQLHIGTSAQEIQKIYPDLVSVNEDGELSVDYARLSIIALAAIKELKTELDELKTNK